MGGADPEKPAAGTPDTAVPLLLRRASGHSALYIATGASTLLVSFASVAALTRFLSPAEFGHLAVLFVGSSLLTLLFNLVTLQGTFAWTFGVSGDDEVEDHHTSDTPVVDRRRALSTGFLLTLGVATTGSLVVVAAAVPLADWLVGDSGREELVIWMTVSAAFTSLWRLAANVVRLERRPAGFLVASLALHV
jgi:hypothetical protein